MRIFIAHEHYRQPGGEDVVFDTEAALLEAAGHHVVRFEAHNDTVEGMGALSLARATVWNRRAYDQVSAILREQRPDVAHFHNTFPLLSPSVYDACRDVRVPVVQTLHNFRLLCPATTLYRSGRLCEDCLAKRVKWPAFVHGCYRGSRGATGVTVAGLAWHHLRGTYRERVDRYVAMTEQERQTFVAGGLPAERIVVKPHSVPDPGAGPGGDHALFVGRLTPEKGVLTLLRAWQRLGPEIALTIVGDGPLRPAVVAAARAGVGIEYLGQQPRSTVLERMRGAGLLVFPSEWYETFGLSMVEALAAGTPVVAGRLGSAEEILETGVTGELFTPGDSDDLVRAVRALRASDTQAFRRNARRAYERSFTPERNLARLVEVYASLLPPA